MADESMKWALDFNLQGDGLRQANAGVSQLLQGLTDGRKGMVEFEAAGARMRVSLDGVGSSTSKAGGALREFGIGAAAAVGMLTSALAAGGVALSKFGDMALKAFGERTSTIRAYTTLLGDAGQAEVEFNKAQSLAAKTDLTAGETVKAQQGLMVAGFRGKSLDSTLLAGMDLASIATGDKNEALKSFARATSQIKQKGKLQQEELLQLAEGSSLSGGIVKQELVKILGVKNTDEVDKRQKAGQISADQGLLAIQRAVLTQLGTKKLGEYATGSSGSVQGLLSNRDEALANLLKGFDSEVLPGMQRYKQALTDQAAQFDLNTAQGQALSLTAQNLADTSLSLKGAWEDFMSGLYDSFSESYSAVLRELGTGAEAWSDTGTSARHLGEDIGRLGDFIARCTNALSGLGRMIDWIRLQAERVAAFSYWMQGGTTAKQWQNVKDSWNKSTDDLRAEGATEDRARRWSGSVVPDDSYGKPGAGAIPAKLKRPAAALKVQGGTNSSGGGGGGGAGGDFGLGYGGAGGGAGALEVANYASDLSASLAGPAAMSGGGGVHVERIEINVHGGAASAGEIADKVHSVLMREIGRFQRTPSPGRS